MTRHQPLFMAVVIASAAGAGCAATQCPAPESAGQAGEVPSSETAQAAVPADSAPVAEVRSQANAELRQVAEGKARIRLLGQGQNAFIGRLEIAPGFAVPEHQDPTEEYIHVLEGHGTLTMDGKAYEIQPGSTIFMPAGATVSYQNGDAPMVAIQVFAGPGPAAKYDSWTPAPAQVASSGAGDEQ